MTVAPALVEASASGNVAPCAAAALFAGQRPGDCCVLTTNNQVVCLSLQYRTLKNYRNPEYPGHSRSFLQRPTNLCANFSIAVPHAEELPQPRVPGAAHRRQAHLLVSDALLPCIGCGVDTIALPCTRLIYRKLDAFNRLWHVHCCIEAAPLHPVREGGAAACIRPEPLPL